MTLPPLFAATPGFLGTRASLMLDVVFVAMFAVVPILVISVYLVASRRRFRLHKQIQIATAAVLLIAVLAFEIDMRFFTDWEKLAEPWRYYVVDQWNTVWTSLVVHLCFAVPTFFVWLWVMIRALRRFPVPPVPGTHSPSHKTWGWIATVGLVMTAITGWTFYYLAFVA